MPWRFRIGGRRRRGGSARNQATYETRKRQNPFFKSLLRTRNGPHACGMPNQIPDIRANDVIPPGITSVPSPSPAPLRNQSTPFTPVVDSQNPTKRPFSPLNIRTTGSRYGRPNAAPPPINSAFKTQHSKFSSPPPHAAQPPIHFILHPSDFILGDPRSTPIPPKNRRFHKIPLSVALSSLCVSR